MRLTWLMMSHPPGYLGRSPRDYDDDDDVDDDGGDGNDAGDDNHGDDDGSGDDDTCMMMILT
eukprot:9044302-Alexandrium_andersonii.AAC.1